MNYNKEEVMKEWRMMMDMESTLSTALDSAFKAGKEEMEKPLREALRMLEDEIPFTGEEVIAKIKEALK